MHRGKIIIVDTIDNIKQKTGAKDLEDAFVKLVGEDKNYEPERQLEKKSFFKKYFGKKWSIGRLILAIVIVAILLIYEFLRK
jgi:hypothetical protein